MERGSRVLCLGLWTRCQECWVDRNRALRYMPVKR